MPKAPMLDPELVHQQVENLSRAPFRGVLARILSCAPTEGAIEAQAEKHPDRWAQTLAIVARLAGFNEKLTVDGSILHTINDLSDSQLEQALVAMRHLDTQSSVRTSGSQAPDPS